MKFSDLTIKSKYDSDEDDILKDFHIPLLAIAKRYDRAVGYFSADVLVKAATGMTKFIQSGGLMRLIIGDPLSDSEYEAVMKGKSDIGNIKSEHLARLLLESDELNLKMLTYMIATNQLEIKFAFTHKGMFHQKIGIFYNENEIVAFSGSANETLAGLSKYNAEEITVFKNWLDSFKEYGQFEIDTFNSLWKNEKKRVKVVDLESDTYLKIKGNADVVELKKELFPDLDVNTTQLQANNTKEIFFKYSVPKSDQEIIEPELRCKIPLKPIAIKDKPFKLHLHQIEAIKNWVASDFKGLFSLATGSGKTITALCAMTQLFETKLRASEALSVIISVPYIELANQWVRELRIFNVFPVKCYESSELWSDSLDTKILRISNRTLGFLCIVVVNRTLVSELFQNKMKKLNGDDMLFIGDECHHLGGSLLFKSLPDSRYRIGLSATPFRSDDDEIESPKFPDESKINLLKYFTGIVSEYTLSDAINDGILTPYRYDIVEVYLDDEEQDMYEEYSRKIVSLISKMTGKGLDADEQNLLRQICSKRSNLVATCKGKLPALVKYIKLNPTFDLKHSLIYVGEGKAPGDDENYLVKVTRQLYQIGVTVSKFTSEENSMQRKNAMASFVDKSIDALVAMKVLDEGIDVPICQSAFILASTRNPRQYIQRRGRVLRKFEGKESALIVDFVVLPQKISTSTASLNLRKAELQRINDFMLTSNNMTEVKLKILELGLDDEY